jgi:ribonucleoside-diphosphate reductase alpha chain
MTTPIITSTGEAFVPRRRRLADERKAITHKFQIGPCEGYITVGLYEDGQPGEIFITLSKDGAQNGGLVDSFATAISLGLQYGVPLKVLVNKFVHARYEPSGATQNPNIPNAKSVVDYIFRWLALKFLTPEERQSVGLYQEPGQAAPTPSPYNSMPGMMNNQSFLSRTEPQG